MRTTLKYLWLMTLIAALVGLVACSDDDDNNNNGNNNPGTPDPWEGTWLSAGTDVAPILVAFAGNDSIRVTFNADQTVFLESHVPATGWSSQNGIYTFTENEGSDILTVHIEYTNPNFIQDGIMQIWTASPDSMYLEAVQTDPDIGATPLTYDQGFGADPALGILNIQKYRKVD